MLRLVRDGEPIGGQGMEQEQIQRDTERQRVADERAEVRARVAELEGILALLTDCIDAELMDAAPKLRVVSNYAVGFDNVDVAAATQRGIAVGNTPGVLTETTADLAFALLMAAARLIVPAAELGQSIDADVRNGRVCVI